MNKHYPKIHIESQYWQLQRMNFSNFTSEEILNQAHMQSCNILDNTVSDDGNYQTGIPGIIGTANTAIQNVNKIILKIKCHEK